MDSIKSTQSPQEPVIVLVDDEKPFTDLMGALLEQGLGVKTVVFNDPLAALEGMGAHHPTLVVSDYRMPHLDGFDFLKEVAARFPGLPSILVTGNQLDEATIAQRKPASLISVLFKPLSWRDIAGVMRRNALLP